MDVDIVFVVSYVVTIVATIGLALYFFREYFRKRLRASLAWGLGLTFYAIAQIGHLTQTVYGEVAMGKAGLGVPLMLVGFGMALLYYGASLLFFNPGSFFREKMASLLLVFELVVLSFLLIALPLEGFADRSRLPIEILLVAPVFLTIAVLFYRVAGRLARDDPRRRTILLVSAGWFLATVDVVYLGVRGYLEVSPILDTLINIVHLFAWLSIFVGMITGRAART